VVNEFLSRKGNKCFLPYREDFMGVATLALVTAGYKFDKDRGFLFRTYASHYSRAMMVTLTRKLVSRWRHEASLGGLTFNEPPVDPYDVEEEDIDLVKKFEPKSKKDKIIYYNVILAPGSLSQKAKKLGISTSVLEEKVEALKGKLTEQFNQEKGE